MKLLCKIFGCRWHVKVRGLDSLTEQERLAWHGLVRVCRRCGRLEVFHLMWRWEHLGDYVTPEEIKELVPTVFDAKEPN